MLTTIAILSLTSSAVAAPPCAYTGDKPAFITCLNTNLGDALDAINALQTDLTIVNAELANQLAMINQAQANISSNTTAISDNAGDIALLFNHVDDVLFLGVRDGAVLSLGSSSDAALVPIAGSGNANGTVLVGNGQALALGLSADVPDSGLYEVNLRTVWGISLNTETVVAEFELVCGGGAVEYASTAKYSLGKNATNNVQVHTDVDATVFIRTAGASTLDCELQKKLTVAGGGSDILFNALGGKSWTSVRRVSM